MHRTILALCIACALLAAPLPGAAQGEPSAAPTTEVEGHPLPAIETPGPAHEHPGEAREGAPTEAVAPDEHTGMMMAGAIFAMALFAGLVGLWFASRQDAH